MCVCTYICPNSTKRTNTTRITKTIENILFSLEQRFPNCYSQPLGLLEGISLKVRKAPDWAAGSPSLLQPELVHILILYIEIIHDIFLEGVLLYLTGRKDKSEAHNSRTSHNIQ